MTSCPSSGQLLATYQPKIFANQEKKDKITNEKFKTLACYLYTTFPDRIKLRFLLLWD